MTESLIDEVEKKSDGCPIWTYLKKENYLRSGQEHLENLYHFLRLAMDKPGKEFMRIIYSECLLNNRELCLMLSDLLGERVVLEDSAYKIS